MCFVTRGAGGLLARPPEHLGDVLLDDAPLLQLGGPLLLALHLLVLLEVLDVLGVDEVFEFRVLVVVPVVVSVGYLPPNHRDTVRICVRVGVRGDVLLPVVNLVLVLVVTVVAGTGAQIRQRLARPDEVNPFLSANREVAIRVQKS